jgi:hypothetical protein
MKKHIKEKEVKMILLLLLNLRLVICTKTTLAL